MQRPEEPFISRRGFIQASSIALASLATGACDAAKDSEVFPALDAHTHFYDPNRPIGVPWPGKKDAKLYRSVLPGELRKLANPFGVQSTIAVEASPWLEDNQWLLDLAAKDKFVVGVVGHLDPANDEFPAQFKRFADNPLFRGVRVNHNNLRKGLENPAYLAHLRLFIEHDLELDVNGGPDMPADVARLVEKLPDLRIVINHAANSIIDGKAPPENWRQGMSASAKGKHVFCKVSALVDSTHRSNGDAPADVEFYRPVLDGLWNTFGEDRLIYASNWPVSDRFATYATVHGIVNSYFRARGEEAARKFFLRNAVAAYKVAV